MDKNFRTKTVRIDITYKRLSATGYDPDSVRYDAIAEPRTTHDLLVKLVSSLLSYFYFTEGISIDHTNFSCKEFLSKFLHCIGVPEPVISRQMEAYIEPLMAHMNSSSVSFEYHVIFDGSVEYMITYKITSGYEVENQFRSWYDKADEMIGEVMLARLMVNE